MSSQPQITVSKDDYERLHTLLEGLPDSLAVERLVDELERAHVLEERQLPADVVTMHSQVVFTVLSTKKTFNYTLVYPHEANEEGLLSVLTPVGSALLGLAVGQEMEWPLEHNKITHVRIDAVSR